MQTHLSAAVVALAVAVSFLVGLDKGGLGGALGVLAVPLLSLALPVQEVVGLLLPVLIVGDIFAVSAHWRRWDARLFWALFPGGVVGTLLGTFVLVSISSAALRIGLGAFVLLFAGYRLVVERRLRERGQSARDGYQRRGWHGWLAGTLSGITSSLAHAGGPPVTAFLLLQEVEPRVFVATSALYFAALNLVKVPSYLIGGVFAALPLPVMLLMIPFIPVGVWLGRRLSQRVERTVFERVIVGLLVMSGVLLIVT